MEEDTANSAPLRRAVAALNAPFRRPLATGGRWRAAAVIVLTLAGLVWAVLAAWLATAADTAHLPTIVMFALLIFVGQLLIADFDGLQVDSSPVFLMAAAISLSPGDAAAAVLLAASLAVYFRPRSWRNAGPVFTTVAGAGMTAIGVAYLIDSTVGDRGWALAAAAVASVAVLLVYDLVWGTVEELLLGEGGLRVAVPTVARDVVVITGPLSVGHAPVAALIAASFAYWEPMALFGLAPYVLLWRLTHQAAKLEQAERLAGTDSLTGLSNRARFFERMTTEIAAAARYDHPLALIMGDLDNFKRVNDTQGHLAGDDVLRATAAAMASVVTDGVFPLARYGGEEFVVAVPVLPREGVLEIAERIRAAVELECGGWGTSISLGVAYYKSDDRIESLVDRADKALYSAKYAGKNRVHQWPGESLEGPVAVPRAA